MCSRGALSPVLGPKMSKLGMRVLAFIIPSEVHDADKWRAPTEGPLINEFHVKYRDPSLGVLAAADR